VRPFRFLGDAATRRPRSSTFVIVGLAPRLMPGDQTDPRSDPRSLTAAATDEKIAWVREAARDRFDSLELNTYPTGGPIVITDHARSEAQSRADRMAPADGHRGQRRRASRVTAHTFGSIAGLTQKVVDIRERFGISSFMLGDIDELAPVVGRLAGT
jgi:hypothetical protein